jgi:hypothetical protein
MLETDANLSQTDEKCFIISYFNCLAMKVIDLFFILLARYYEQSGNENASTDAFPASPNTVLYKKIGVFLCF